MSAGMRAAASLQLDHGVRTGIGQLIEKCKQLSGLKTAKWECPIARICHLAYIAIRRREGTDPWSVGTTSARPSGPPREIPDGPFLCYDTCRAHFAGAATLVPGRLRLAGAHCACRTAIGRTSNKSAAAKLGPVIVLPTASTVRIAEKFSTNTDAFQA